MFNLLSKIKSTVNINVIKERVLDRKYWFNLSLVSYYTIKEKILVYSLVYNKTIYWLNSFRCEYKTNNYINLTTAICYGLIYEEYNIRRLYLLAGNSNKKLELLYNTKLKLLNNKCQTSMKWINFILRYTKTKYQPL